MAGPKALSFRLYACLQAIATITLLFTTVLAKEQQQSVNVALTAPFNPGPYVLELLEAAAQENETSYFPLLDRIAEGAFAEAETEKELYTQFKQVLQDDGHLTEGAALSLFDLSMALRATAPRIEAHYQYYNTSVEPLVMTAQDAACPTWALFEGKQFCSPSLERAQQGVSGDPNPAQLPFDRVLGDKEAAPLVLYVDILSPQFPDFHQKLSQRARQGEFSYRVRYRPSPTSVSRPLTLGGYGVELTLKRTDYIVIDDRTVEKENSPEDQKHIEEAKSQADLQPLSSSEVSTLGLAAASYVLDSSDPFNALLELTQDFPRRSSSVAGYNVSEAFLNELNTNREKMLRPGSNRLWINGELIDDSNVDAFYLLEHIRKENKMVKGIGSIGFSTQEAVDILALSLADSSASKDNVLRFDYRDDIEGNRVILWLNNLEKDMRYSKWTSSALALLRPFFPGQLPPVRRDIHNVVIPANFTDAADVEMVTTTIRMLINRRIPARFGIVPSLARDGSVEQAKVLAHLNKIYGPAAIMEYLEQALAKGKLSRLDESIVQDIIKNNEPIEEDSQEMSLADILKDEHLNDVIESTRSWFERLAIEKTSDEPIFFTNGVPLPRDEDFLPNMASRLSRDFQGVQRALYHGVYDDGSWLPDYYLRDALTGRNTIVAPEDDEGLRLVDMNGVLNAHEQALTSLPRIASKDSSWKDWRSVILVADLDSEHGKALLQNLLQFQQSNLGLEISLLHSGSSPMGHLSQGLEPGQLDAEQVLASITSDDALDKQVDDTRQEHWQSTQELLQALGLSEGDSALVYNGRVVGPLSSDQMLDYHALSILQDYEWKGRISPVVSAIETLDLSEKISTPMDLARLSSQLAIVKEASAPESIFGTVASGRSRSFEEYAAEHSAIVLAKSAESSISIDATVDPTSEVAQRWLPILKVLSEVDGVRVRILLNPREDLDELPIKRFYRHVLTAAPSFHEDGSVADPRAVFQELPKETLFTLGMDVPQAWLVTSKESVHDLDNLKLNTVKDGADVNAVYELEYILIEGHSRDVTLGVPPRGVQLLLGTESKPDLMDTIVMANLGYFQFKSRPGHWHMKLKEGPSEIIYHLDSGGAHGFKPTPGDAQADVTLMSFQGKVLFPRLSRNPGHEEDDVLEGSVAQPSMKEYLDRGVNFVSSLFSSSGSRSVEKSKHADINIFSVASGHLYERMLNIMMVSVMRHTKHSVKFWFIEQFLSPSFKTFLPHMAEEYGFEYEMVTYKWPHWLRHQSEKQRQIWGYKILFLDVLFPLSLDKVIFVDADQIVRTDLYDLVQFDLEGAPYGFTPMCDSRTEMEGFRFWKQGYWKTFLNGLPYHISALYVVDLDRFRALAAGDRLRGQYQALSADKNSLSNLDQDLPNNMQRVLPIKSLPQDWLWCETWCSDEALTTARTIDLCNNPLTKEPKLDRARRQVPEWTEYDEEIAGLARRVADSEDEQAHTKRPAHEEL